MRNTHQKGTPMSKPSDAPRSLLQRAGIVWLLLTLGALALNSAPAFAGSVHALDRAFGEKGSAAGQLELAANSGVAVNDSTHDVYVADTGNRRVDEFNDEGVFIRAFGKEVGPLGEDVCTTLSTCKAGTSGPGPGEFEAPTFVAVDNSPGGEGDVYVADTATNLIQKFTAEGELMKSWGAEGQLGTAPIVVATATGNVVTGSKEVTGVKLTSGKFHQAQEISGEGIPAGDLYAEEEEPANEEILPLRKPATETKKGVALTARRPLAEKIGGIAVNPAGDLWIGSGEPSNASEIAQDGSFIQEVYNYQLGGYLEDVAVDGTEVVYLSDAEGVFELSDAEGVFDLTPPGTKLSSKVSGPSTGLSVDQSTGELYLDRGSSLEAFGAEGGLADVFTSSSLSNGGGAGLAVDSSTEAPLAGRVYVTNGSTDRVEAYSVALEVTTGAASEIAATSATLNGSINPEGAPVRECKFEYAAVGEYETTGEYEHSVPCEHPGAAEIAGTSPVPVHAKVSGLVGGTVYDFRLVAEHENAMTHETRSAPGAQVRLETLPVPVLADAEAKHVTAGGAELYATVDPEGLAVRSCTFEYGTTTAYGTSVPCEQKKSQIGSGSAPVPVSAAISGLVPNTEYHWRLVAEDVDGVSVTIDQTFVYPTTGPELPDDRAYEMVTPPFKNGGLIGDVFYGFPPAIAESGARVTALTIQCFAPTESCNADRANNGEPFEFNRTPTGWVATALAPSARQFSENTPWGVNANEGNALFSMPSGPAGEDEWYARSPEGSFLSIGPITLPGEELGVNSLKGSTVIETTADLSRIVWGPHGQLYEYAGLHGSRPFLVGVTGGMDSAEPISACDTELGGKSSAGYPWNGLSQDGRTAYFTAYPNVGACPPTVKAPPVAELYARMDGEEAGARTVAISQPEAPETLSSTPPDNNCVEEACRKDIDEPANWRTAEFAGASVDGSKAFFLDPQRLTDSAVEGAGGTAYPSCAEVGLECNLYLYDFGAPAGENLIDVSASALGGGSPRVQGVLATSADGSHVYFVANGALVSGASPGDCTEALSGRCDLYVYERDARYPAGHITFIETLPGADSHQWDQTGFKRANVTPDGRFLVFESGGQVFRYDAETNELTRVSIGNDGFDDNGNAGEGSAQIVPAFKAVKTVGSARGNPTMSNDGSRVFFESPRALTPHALDDASDGNGYAENVYEWHEGHVYLISDGHDTSSAEVPACGTGSAVCLLGTDATGANVFFTTADQLVPSDTDTQVDIYDARICEPENGNPCIAEPPQPLPPCLGEACHGIPAPVPSLLTPGTASFNGEGNIAPVVAPPAKRVAPKAVKCKKGFAKNKKGRCVKKPRKKTKKAKKSNRRKK
jgi:hypothetical protein